MSIFISICICNWAGQRPKAVAGPGARYLMLHYKSRRSLHLELYYIALHLHFKSRRSVLFNSLNMRLHVYIHTHTHYVSDFIVYFTKSLVRGS